MGARGLPKQTKKLKLGDLEIDYALVISERAKRLRLSVRQDSSVLVTIPSFFSEKRAERFVLEKAQWVLKNVLRFRSMPSRVSLGVKRGDYVRYKDRALALAKERLSHFNQIYGFCIKSVSIRNQKTRWGSCSRRGALSFNYKIALLPAELVDYVVVHELCHLGEFNHSAKFWKLVEKSVPNHKEQRKKLRFITS